jgi:hypothetical protein
MQAAHPAEQVNGTEHRDSAVRTELERIVSSPAFRGSRRCCRFLEYSVQHVLQGNSQEDLRERNIGIEVFHRPPDYDTAEDAIVRVTANEVRKRLAQVYQESGSDFDPVITLPPGSYAVAFRWKPANPVPVPAPVVSKPAASGRRMRFLIAAACLLSAVVLVSILFLTRTLPTEVRRQNNAPADLVWSRVFQPGRKTNIIMADAARFEIQELLGRDLSLRDYLSPDYPGNLLSSASPELQRVIRFMGLRQTTSIASVSTGTRLREFGQGRGVNPVLRHPRHVNAREFNTDNFILLGSRLSVPWVELFEPSLNFLMIVDPETHRFAHALYNRAPRAGEPVEFVRSMADDVTYADIALVPNMARSGTVLILNGIDMVSVEAAGEFAMSGALSASLGGRTGPVEILLRVRSIAGTASKSEVIAIRDVHPGVGALQSLATR